MSTRKEEEKKILAEMDEAMKTQAAEDSSEKKENKLLGMLQDKTPEKIHCRKCKTLLENGVCPTCGFRMYMGMDEKLQKKIRWILGGICLVVFVIILIVSEMK